MIRFAAVSAAVAVAVLSASAAAASDYRVAFGDLDLGSPAGASQFDRRLARAARSACATGSRTAEAECRAAFRSEVLGLLPAVRLQDYARARDGVL